MFFLTIKWMSYFFRKNNILHTSYGGGENKVFTIFCALLNLTRFIIIVIDIEENGKSPFCVMTGSTALHCLLKYCFIWFLLIFDLFRKLAEGVQCVGARPCGPDLLGFAGRAQTPSVTGTDLVFSDLVHFASDPVSKIKRIRILVQVLI